MQHRDGDGLPDFEAPDERIVTREIVRVHRETSSSRWLPIVVGIGSLVIQLAALSWYGGQIAQRVNGLEERTKEQANDIGRITERNSTQGAQLAIIQQQYSEISSRLQRIEGKLYR